MALQDRYINLTSDFGFKRIFGTDMNKDLLIGFLNALFNGRHVIKDVTFKSNEHLGANGDMRRAIFDVYCLSDDGSRFIVEMQNAYQDFYKDRSVYYSTFPISEQAQKGEWNYELEPVYTIGILNFAFPENKGSDRVLTEVKLMNTCTKEVFYDKFSLIYIELANFHQDEFHLASLFDKWLFVLKNMQRLMERPASLQERVFQRLFNAAEIATYTPVDRKEYEQSQRAYNDIKIAVDSAKREGEAKGMAKGRAEGMAKGRAEGMAKGRAEGMAKGRAEGIAEGERANALRNAAAMKRDGMAAGLIARYTGLTEEEIEAL